MSSLPDRERAIRQKLKDDFPHYAERCLTIRPKEGGTAKLKLNEAQRYIHERLEEQLREKGWVRAIILKGRQQGCSTYVEGRFYWRLTHSRGARAFILTHEVEATNNLFEMVERYHENVPAPVKPATGASNAKELSFPGLDCEYKVGTAGNKATGRSSTIRYFHGSEVAYWPNAEEHAKGVMQAVPREAGTEVIHESTANGAANYFARQWDKAEKGESDFIAIFVPWFWQREYRATPPSDFARTGEEIQVAERFGLDDEQVYWRRLKIAELGGVDEFKQEYPSTAREAFEAPVLGAYYAREMSGVESDGRLTDVPYDPRHPVITAWDLGYSDMTVIWFVQCVGDMVHVIDHYARNGVGLDHYAKVLREKPYSYAEHLLPHDIEHGEVGSGDTRIKTLRSLSIGKIKVVENIPVDDGINAVRMLLPRCRFDRVKCEEGVKGLKEYRRQWDEKFQAFRPRPLHDWCSDHADAFRYLAVGLKPPMKAKPVQLQQTKWIV